MFGLWFRYGFGMFWMLFWYGFDMVWFWYGLGTERLFQGSWRGGFKKGNGNSPGTAFWSISRGFWWFWYDFAVVLIWFWYDFDMIWYGFDTVLIWFQWVGFKKKKQKQPRDRFLVDFSRFFLVLIWFWYFDTILIRFKYLFDTILIWFWYGVDMVPVSWLQKKKQKQPRDRFLVDFSRVFFVVLIRYDFDTILIRFWYDFDMVLIRFWIWFRWVGFKSQVWPTSRIITETISKSYLKPYQHHNCKTTPETIHNSKSYLKRIKIIKTFILKYFILEISDVINLAAVNIPRGLAYVDVRDRMSKNRFLRHLQYFRMVFLQWLPFFIAGTALQICPCQSMSFFWWHAQHFRRVVLCVFWQIVVELPHQVVGAVRRESAWNTQCFQLAFSRLAWLRVVRCCVCLYCSMLQYSVARHPKTWSLVKIRKVPVRASSQQ